MRFDMVWISKGNTAVKRRFDWRVVPDLSSGAAELNDPVPAKPARFLLTKLSDSFRLEQAGGGVSFEPKRYSFEAVGMPPKPNGCLVKAQEEDNAGEIPFWGCPEINVGNWCR
jgi:hypothetical protein